MQQSADLQVPLSLFAQNKEGRLVQELCKSELGEGQLHLSESPSPITFSLSQGCPYGEHISS